MYLFLQLNRNDREENPHKNRELRVAIHGGGDVGGVNQTIYKRLNELWIAMKKKEKKKTSCKITVERETRRCHYTPVWREREK